MTLQTEFRNAMAQPGSAVSVITTDGAAGKFGFTASAVCSVTDQPPTLLVCMNRNSYAHEHFRRNGVLCVNVLSSSHQELSGVFANASLRSDQRFLHDSWQVMSSGAPVLSSLSTSFDCLIADCHGSWQPLGFLLPCRPFASANNRVGWSILTAVTMPSGMTLRLSLFPEYRGVRNEQCRHRNNITTGVNQDAGQMRKLVIASVLGNALEWYDFFLYGTAAALVFGPLFFPVGGDPQGTLAFFRFCGRLSGASAGWHRLWAPG